MKYHFKKRMIIIKSFFLFLLIYPTFHYILKYTSSGTSPTYGNVPFSWQIGKYIMLFVFSMLILMYFSFEKKIKKITLIFIISFLPVIIYNILLIILHHININEIKYIYIFLVLSPLIFLNRKSLFIFIRTYEGMLDFFIIFSIITNFYVIFSFLFFDRLPAQAYPGTIMIRFAGLWDMPNAFGFFNSFLLYIALIRKYRVRSFLLFLNVILTLSISSLFVLIFGFIIYLKKRRKLFIGTVIFTFLLFLFVINFFDLLYHFFQLKKGSILVHLEYFKNYPFLSIFEGKIYFNESFIQSFLYNYFPFSLILLILIIYLGIENINSFEGVYVLMFLISNLFIPNIYAFPINVFFIVCLYILLNKNYKLLKIIRI